MRAYKLIVTAAVMSFIALPVAAQTGAKDGNNDHHYSGGPKSEVPHHIGKKESSGSKKSAGGSHHYSGGPKTEVPHHMGKKETTGRSTKAASGGHHYTGGPNSSAPHHMGDKTK